jgi:hypothetical protein
MFFMNKKPEQETAYKAPPSPFSTLSDFEQKQYLTDQKRLARLTGELMRQPRAEAKQAQSFQEMFVNQLRSTIDESVNSSLSDARSDLAKRFGGAYNATFGNDLLSKIEGERFKSIRDAKIDASLMGQQLLENANQARMQKIQLLQGQLSNLQAAGYLQFHRSPDILNGAVNRYQSNESNRGGILGKVLGAARNFLPFI